MVEMPHDTNKVTDKFITFLCQKYENTAGNKISPLTLFHPLIFFLLMKRIETMMEKTYQFFTFFVHPPHHIHFDVDPFHPIVQSMLSIVIFFDHF